MEKRINTDFGSYPSALSRTAGSSVSGQLTSTQTQKHLAGDRSVIACGCRVHGSLEFEGRLQIDGYIEGQLVVNGELTIGELGSVKSQIYATSAVIFGKVKGDIHCRDRIELQSGAQVFGDIYSPRVVMQDGVLFDGNCRMVEPELNLAVEKVNLEKGNLEKSSLDKSDSKSEESKLTSAMANAQLSIKNSDSREI